MSVFAGYILSVCFAVKISWDICRSHQEKSMSWMKKEQLGPHRIKEQEETGFVLYELDGAPIVMTIMKPKE